MNLGIAVGFQNPAEWRVPWDKVYADTLEYVLAAENLGFDQVWLPEHHFSDDGFNPSLLPVAAAIAARTTRIRIGTKIVILPFHDPIRLAEDIAVVDNLSDGRLEVGVAAGYRKAEFDAFCIPREERGARMQEGVDLLIRALGGEVIHHEGFHSYAGAKVMPPPLQQPVPLWLGGRTRAAIKRAARYGSGFALADFDVEAACTDYALYRQALEELQRDPADYGVCAVTTVFVDEDADRAWDLAGPHLLYQHNQYVQWFNEVEERPWETGLLDDVDALRDSSVLIGTPEQVLERLLEFHQRLPFTHLSFFGLLAGMPLGVGLCSLQLIADEVLPALHELSSPEANRGPASLRQLSLSRDGGPNRTNTVG